MRKNFLAGEWVAGANGSPNINPSDLSDVIDEFAAGDAAAVQRAVPQRAPRFRRGRSRRRSSASTCSMQLGRKSWRAKASSATCSRAKKERLLPEATGEAARAGAIFKFFAGEALRMSGEVLASVRPGLGVEVTREPVGVVGLITPWNFPIAIPAWKIAPALAYGNCVVFKPADLVPGCGWALADIISRSGIPAGVFNLVMGRGSAVGQAIVDSPRHRRDQLHRLGRDRQTDRRRRAEADGEIPARDGRQEPARRAG